MHLQNYDPGKSCKDHTKYNDIIMRISLPIQSLLENIISYLPCTEGYLVSYFSLLFTSIPDSHPTPPRHSRRGTGHNDNGQISQWNLHEGKSQA